MCLPAVAIGALATVPTIIQHRAATKAAKSQAQQLSQNALVQTEFDMGALKTRTYQEDTRITLESIRRLRQGLRERGALTARLADAGVGGSSTLRDAIASVIQEEEELGTIETKRSFMRSQAYREREAIHMGYAQQRGQAQSVWDSRPSWVSTGLEMMGSYASGYGIGLKLQERRSEAKAAQDNMADVPKR